ncbi:MAG: DUF2147 domain-containing protein [Legionellales bacterium]|nr:DUF2147 domain-containing protein [Legionellales bacterium]
MRRWKWMLSLVAAVVYLPVVFASTTPAGNWTTIDDKTGVKRAQVHFIIQDGVMSGTVAKVYPRPGDSGICSSCPGEFKDKPTLGMRIVWGLRDKGDGTWDGGRILDAKTGKIYRVKITMKGDQLIVRGYIGLSMLGRTQVWERVG